MFRDKTFNRMLCGIVDEKNCERTLEFLEEYLHNLRNLILLGGHFANAIYFFIFQ